MHQCQLAAALKLNEKKTELYHELKPSCGFSPTPLSNAAVRQIKAVPAYPAAAAEGARIETSAPPSGEAAQRRARDAWPEYRGEKRAT